MDQDIKCQSHANQLMILAYIIGIHYGLKILYINTYIRDLEHDDFYIQ